MQMAKFPPAFLLIVLLALISVKMPIPLVNAGCQFAVIGGGCPDRNECGNTCKPCYRGIGQVHYYCRPAGGGIPYDQCICWMSNGAPCNPTGPPRCPRPWPPPTNINATSNLTLT